MVANCTTQWFMNVNVHAASEAAEDSCISRHGDKTRMVVCQYAVH